MPNSKRRNGPASFFIKASLLACPLLFVACDRQSKTEPPENPRTGNPLRTGLDRKVDTLVSAYMEKSGTVGLCLGILKGDSVVVYGYGETGKGNGRIPDAHTLFEIGSITKTMTAALAAGFSLTEGFALDSSIAGLLPEGTPRLEIGEQEVTLVNLLNHTSGLPGIPGDLAEGYDPEKPYRHYDKRKVYAYLKPEILESIPGRAYSYSNLGMGLIGLLLEDFYGKPYETLVTEKLCQPLGMQGTRIRFGDAEKDRMAQGHDQNGKPVPAWDEMGGFEAAGALRSNAGDLLKYARALLGSAPSALDPALRLCQLTTFKSADGEFGLSWFKSTESGSMVLSHGGATAGFTSYLGFSKEKQVGLVVLTNSAGRDLDEVLAALGEVILK